jgi:hypothetical protein
MDDEQKQAYDRLGLALADVVTVGLKDHSPEVGRAVADGMEAGRVKIRFEIEVGSDLSAVCAVIGSNDSRIELFRVEGANQLKFTELVPGVN